MKRTALALTLISALFISTLGGAQFVSLGRADFYFPDWVQEGEVAPPSGTKPPTISIFSPENNTVYASNNVSLNFNVSNAESSNVSLSLTELYYRASWQQLMNISVWSPLYYSFPIQLSINLTGIPEGPHWLEVYAVERGEITTRQEITNGIYWTTYYVIFKISSSSVVSFTIDTTSPKVSILSLENKTYSAPDVPLSFITNEQISQTTYSLDGQGNVTIGGNTTLSGLSNGAHNVTVYAWDKAGNIGASETVIFSVAEPEPFLMALVVACVATVAVISAGLLIYFRKRNHARISKHSEIEQSSA